MAKDKTTQAQNPGIDGEESWERKEVAEDLPAWDSKLIPRIIGRIERVAIEAVSFEDGPKRDRALVVLLTDDGEKVIAWLPAMFEGECKRAIGKRVRITREGTGKRDTRFFLDVSRR